VQSVKEEETVRVLVEFGANVLSQTPDGITPLHWAAARGLVETMDGGG
jgi:ankyrin repeat protein